MGPIPPWLRVVVHQNVDKAKVGPQDLGTALRYKLMPGETTNIDLTIDITDPDMVKRLNSGELALDDVLVLRISNGRDYFVPIRGTWLQTCFYRSVEELVRIPAGVRSLTMVRSDAEAQYQPMRAVVHSAPQEIFTLTDLIPKTAERVAAEWSMLHEEEEPPWLDGDGTPWPFDGNDLNNDPMIKDERLAEIREALDMADPVDEHLSSCTDPAEKLELLCETLLSFLGSLTDGIVTAGVWQRIESKIHAYEKGKPAMTPETLQETVMEAISTTPVHSVSFTFIIFMLNRLISEVAADARAQAESVSTPTRRSRSSTSASALSDVSLSSLKSNSPSQTRRSFLPSLPKIGPSSSTSSTPDSPTSLEGGISDTRNRLAHRYAEVFAPIVIRSDNGKMKVKDKKAQLARKIIALEAFLDS